MSNWKVFANGIIKENPVLVMLLGTCPTLAVTTLAQNSIGMGLAATFVLICSNVVISMVKNVVPKQVRLPSYIIIIAGFVTFVSFILQKFVPNLYDALGIYLPLITVNCIILGRAEMFASKNKVFASFLDGLGMGIGFTLALFIIGSIRELLGSGTYFGNSIGEWYQPIKFFTSSAGGFFVFGVVIAVVNILTHYKISSKKIGCGNCPNSVACAGVEKGACK
ncbi:electron transport complex subunit E [Paludicola sp. MB14-C6]|uniref:electron transport complex subunit RsxE n=1 Tax=Paludihabitans sp. MB14-C6 TaxID=3070656 RepID=UPI0027DC6D15|nr:electron transport complex subunit E [Paludicola sp. MB14-C6]WMJ23308.1 electron transport complex subunit E [Paludicola sp. MB14-C6]